MSVVMQGMQATPNERAFVEMTDAEGASSVGVRRNHDGTVRCRHPTETLRLLGPVLDAAGVTRLAVVTGLDLIGIPVVMVTRPLSFGVSVTQGKGATLDAAKVSGLMEALEHYHAENVDADLRYVSESALCRERVIRTEALAGRSRQYSKDDRMLWQRAQSLRDGGAVWVPFDCVHLDLRVDGPASQARFRPTSNGLASGNSFLEAVCHATFEVIERELTWSFFGLPAMAQESRRLDLDTVEGVYSSSLLRKLRTAGVDATVWDLSSELEVPCFLCEILDAAEDVFRPIPVARGVGCHSLRDVALTRAICEAVQSRLTLISGARDDIQPLSSAQRLQSVRRAREQLEARRRRPAPRSYVASPSHDFDSFDPELSWLVRSILERGFGEPVVVDLSKRSFPIHVVRVVVPGMRFPIASMRGSPEE